MSGPLSRALPGLFAAAFAGPLAAMPQCPPGSVKPVWFEGVGWAVLALAVCAGAAVPLWAWRRSRVLAAVHRRLLMLGACLVMPLVWIAGLLVWLGGFVLPC